MIRRVSRTERWVSYAGLDIDFAMYVPVVILGCYLVNGTSRCGELHNNN